MKKYRISYVSYMNTIPFRYALENSRNLRDHMQLERDIPSECARKLLDDEVDIGLVPVAILSEMKDYHIISDYCIGAEGKVESVVLASEVPLEEIESIYLDYQSRTSVNLTRILASEYWKIQPQWIAAQKGFEKEIKGTRAGVIIGDRVFNTSKKYMYDLAGEWYGFTGLPFVFAAWVANKPIDSDFIKVFNLGLQYGLNNLEKAVDDFGQLPLPRKKILLYLNHFISYHMDDDKKKAMKIFLSLLKQTDKANV